VITRLPSSLKCETAACAFGDYVYVVGLGRSSDEIWRYRLSSCALRGGADKHDSGSTEWTLCSRLVIGRRRHCLAVVGRQLYVLGGIAGSDDSTILDSIEVCIAAVYHPSTICLLSRSAVLQHDLAIGGLSVCPYVTHWY